MAPGQVTQSAMTPLARIIADQIRATGPLTVADYMTLALAHPEHGYYRRQDPLGAAGDFTTAPEISQMFGELIGLWCVTVWRMMGAPEAIRLVELGPGRGTLMADLLRAASADPGFMRAASVHLVETSPVLRGRQGEALADRLVTWHDRVEELPDGPLLVVANEFFDALPIHQYLRLDGAWRERMVDADADGILRFALGEEAQPDLLAAAAAAPDGAIAETCPVGREIAGWLGRRLANQGGAALIIDYGPARSAVGDSLQAVRDHAYHPVLSQPGDADLTAHVDFQALAEAAAPARGFGPVCQGDWLQQLGIGLRAAQLVKSNPQRLADVQQAFHRLIHPDEMGTLFKVLALAHPALTALPGFESAVERQS
jgi:SAM-dependent MidA family methyltransferase